MAKNLPKRIYTSIKLIKSINSRPEIKIDDGSQSQTKSSLMSSDSIIIKLFYPNQTRYKFEHRGEAALRINCDTLDTFRTKECKEIIETVKINNLQLKVKFQ